jgi:hypothetical protein
MKFEPIDILGIIGGILFLFAFYRTSIGKWTGKSFWYEMDNLLGAVFMSVYAFSKTAYISIILNIVWGLVAFKGIQPYAERRLGREMKKTRRNFKKMTKRKKPARRKRAV